MLTLFVVSSLEGWPQIMLHAVDSTEPGEAPQQDASEFSVVFFIVFIFIGSFFFLNLFIGVIFETFNEAKRSESSIVALFLPRDHVLWVEIQELLIQSKPRLDLSKRPERSLRGAFYTVAKSVYFEVFIIVCILINTLQMAVAYDGAPKGYKSTLETVNFVFTVIFILEAGVKLIGLNLKGYFHSRWNRFDFFVVAASVMDLVFTYVLGSSVPLLRLGPQLIRVVRVLRVSRLVRLLKVLKGIQELMTVLAHSVTAILNVLLLVLLIFFIYAILGVFILHELPMSGAIDEYTNFEDFGMAMMALLRIATGENWNGIMYDASRHVGGWCILYFTSFITITTFIMLNLFVMVILQNYDDFENNPSSAITLFNVDSKVFHFAWARVCRGGTGKRVHFRELVNLMYYLGEDLGAPFDADLDSVLKKLSLMNVYVDANGFVYFHDVLHVILRSKYTRELRNPNRNPKWKQILRLEEKKTARELEKLRNDAKIAYFGESSTAIGTGESTFNLFFTAIYMKVVFRSWKKYVEKKKTKLLDISSATPQFSELEFPGYNSLLSPE